MKERNWESIITKHLDGVATIEEVADLSKAIESDESVRLLYLRMARVHAVLATSPNDVGRVVSIDEERPISRRWWMQAAAVFVVLLASFAMVWFEASPQVVITDINGAVRWTRIDGDSRYTSTPGSSVSAGTLESMTPDSSATLKFEDGSTVTISGRSNLMLLNEDGKILSLREGLLFASVEPQRSSKPLRLNTSTAEMTVLGTRFDVIADDSQTQIIVNEGRVGLQRIADDSTVEVQAGYHTKATLEALSPLQTMAISGPARTWKADLEHDVDHGRWVPVEILLRIELGRDIDAGRIQEKDARQVYAERLANVPEGSGAIFAEPVRNQRETLYFSSLSAKRNALRPILLSAEARFRIQGKVSSPSGIAIGVVASDVERSNAGRFVVRRRIDAGGFDLQIPVNELKEENFLRGAVGLELFSLYFYSAESESELRITSAELMGN